jgi:hypothetical protein
MTAIEVIIRKQNQKTEAIHKLKDEKEPLIYAGKKKTELTLINEFDNE